MSATERLEDADPDAPRENPPVNTPRLHVDGPLQADVELSLPPSAARHVQVLRLQPGAALTLFDGHGGQWDAEVTHIGRRDVLARVRAHHALERELDCSVTLALGMPANERMDGLVEKATELGAACIQPLVCERSVLRLAGERAERKAEHWRAVAAAACEQSGRNRLPTIAVPTPLHEWLRALPPVDGETRLLSSLATPATPLVRYADLASRPRVTLLSGPEGGLTEAEQALALAAGFTAVSLGARVLRADTAPLAALAFIAALEGH